ncbi:hypothetical protein MNAN1_000525 [Malassezia nana]|uniref:Transmembrane protein n=1 Tax=Malassezia nana TaxID=180528 RepID=A0AAF0EJ58_9BASI|nr:hypothetical protein MNAN1_000525 [Malassezia nana]
MRRGWRGVALVGVGLVTLAYAALVPPAPLEEAYERMASSVYQLRHGTPPPWHTDTEDHWRIGTRFAQAPTPRSPMAQFVSAVWHTLFAQPVWAVAYAARVCARHFAALAHVLFAPVRALAVAMYTGLVVWPWCALHAMAPVLYQLYVIGGVAALLGLGLGLLSVVLLGGEHGLYRARGPRRRVK